MSQLPGDVSSLSLGWTFQRSDGVGFATANHDRALLQDGQVFEPFANMLPERLRLSERMVDSLFSVRGSLSSGALKRADLVGGRWNGSSVLLHVVDWSAASQSTLICRSELGSVRLDEQGLSAELNVRPSSLLESPCVQTSSHCRAVLGDKLCGVDMRGRRRRIRIEGVEDNWLMTNRPSCEEFLMGRFRWLSGERAGVEHQIIDVEDGKIRINDQPSHISVEGEQALVSEGCDGNRSTCASRFHNILNFRGEPDLPGTDHLLRYPGA